MTNPPLILLLTSSFLYLYSASSCYSSGPRHTFERNDVSLWCAIFTAAHLAAQTGAELVFIDGRPQPHNDRARIHEVFYNSLAGELLITRWSKRPDTLVTRTYRPSRARVSDLFDQLADNDDFCITRDQYSGFEFVRLPY